MIVCSVFILISIWTMAAIGLPSLNTSEVPKKTSPFALPKADLEVFNVSLKPNFNFRGYQVINPQPFQLVQINTNVMYQQGNFTFSVPTKKNVILNGRVAFGPSQNR